MSLKLLALIAFMLTTNAFAYSTLNCSSNQGITYSAHSKLGGARPFPGMITYVEEIKIDNEVIYRKVHREECDQDSFCNIEQPEIVDINADASFNFIQDSKHVLSSEGEDMDPIKKETYAIKFVLEKEIWMLCDSYLALYP
ncbi:MAG: hypothetical protein V4654_11325 [Bdellovibrionota bacterium]